MLRKTAVPDATHYVGYVEDEETPEMIMKKFEEMERIKAASRRPAEQQQAAQQADTDAAGPSGATAAPGAAARSGASDVATEQLAAAAAAGDDEGPLDQQQLQEIFKATSMYNVKSLLGNNEALMVDAAAARAQADRGLAAADIGLDSGVCGVGGLLC